MNDVQVSAVEAAEAGIQIASGSKARTGLELLAFADVSFTDVADLRPELSSIRDEIGEQLKRDALYANYIERQARDVEAMRRDEAQPIPDGFDYEALTGLSNELRQKLKSVRPATLGHAGRVEGMTPAALTLILARIRQDQRKRA